uniref:Major facilitator superfamily MFS_1 n=1 Tax=Caulobacter sp. (strain K31) TaxID=366602 RepID=B0T6N4_CAUSK
MASIERASTLSTPRLFSFSTIALPLGALVIAINVYLPAHLASHLGVSMTVVGSAWAAVRLIDLAVDPMLGVLMDRTNTRLGRYRAWILVGGPILMLATWALFEAPRDIGPVYLIGWLLALYLGQSILTMGQSAWAAGLAPSYDDRSRAFGAISIATVTGGIMILMVPLLGARVGWSSAAAAQAMGWFVVILVPIVVLTATTLTPERLPVLRTEGLRLRDFVGLLTKPDLVRLFFAQLTLTMGPGWMSALYLFYFTSARGFSAQQASLLLLFYIVAGVVGAIVIARLAVVIGKHRALILVALVFAADICATNFAPKGDLLRSAPLLAIAGFAAAGFDLTIRAMLADVGDEVRLEQGREQLSLIYALNALANKLASAFAIGLTFPLLAYIGFNPADGAANTPQAVRGLELAYVIGPVVFVTVGAFCLIGWKLDSRRHAAIRRLLDEHDARAVLADVSESLPAAEAGVALTVVK